MDAATTDLVFSALGDATRRDILRRAAGAEHSVSALARNYPMSVAAVQKHVAVLERAQLVKKRRSGREQLISSRPEAIAEARDALAALADLWRDRLDRFGRVLEATLADLPEKESS